MCFVAKPRSHPPKTTTTTLCCFFSSLVGKNNIKSTWGPQIAALRVRRRLSHFLTDVSWNVLLPCAGMSCCYWVFRDVRTPLISRFGYVPGPWNRPTNDQDRYFQKDIPVIFRVVFGVPRPLDFFKPDGWKVWRSAPNFFGHFRVYQKSHPNKTTKHLRSNHEPLRSRLQPLKRSRIFIFSPSPKMVTLESPSYQIRRLRSDFFPGKTYIQKPPTVLRLGMTWWPFNKHTNQIPNLRSYTVDGEVKSPFPTTVWMVFFSPNLNHWDKTTFPSTGEFTRFLPSDTYDWMSIWFIYANRLGEVYQPPSAYRGGITCWVVSNFNRGTIVRYHGGFVPPGPWVHSHMTWNLENLYVQQDIHLHSWWIFQPVMLVLGIELPHVFLLTADWRSMKRPSSKFSTVPINWNFRHSYTRPVGS